MEKTAVKPPWKSLRDSHFPHSPGDDGAFHFTKNTSSAESAIYPQISRTKRNFFIAAFLAITLGTAAQAERISVRHIQLPRHAAMVARSETGRIIARVEFTQAVQGDEVTMRLTYHFVDGSIDDETTTYRQQGTFQLVRNDDIGQRV